MTEEFMVSVIVSNKKDILSKEIVVFSDSEQKARIISDTITRLARELGTMALRLGVKIPAEREVV